jgi:hypothetical protein
MTLPVAPQRHHLVPEMVEMMLFAEEMRVVGGEQIDHLPPLVRIAPDQRDIVAESLQPLFPATGATGASGPKSPSAAAA